MDSLLFIYKQTTNFFEHNIVKLRKNILLNNVFIKNNVNIVSNRKIGAAKYILIMHVISKNINCITNKKRNFFYHKK